MTEPFDGMFIVRPHRPLTPAALSLCLSIPESTIGGSWVVDPFKANDIDFVIPEWIFTHDTQEALLRKGFHQLQSGDEKYDEIDNMRLIAVLERKPFNEPDEMKINIIVVGKYFWPAYYGAIKRMTRYPENYQTREERVSLHRGLCKQIADIIEHDLGY